jgi:hypothetical protein
MRGAGVGTASPNRGCTPGTPPYSSAGDPTGDYLKGAGGDALSIHVDSQLEIPPAKN